MKSSKRWLFFRPTEDNVAQINPFSCELQLEQFVIKRFRIITTVSKRSDLFSTEDDEHIGLSFETTWERAQSRWRRTMENILCGRRPFPPTCCTSSSTNYNGERSKKLDRFLKTIHQNGLTFRFSNHNKNWWDLHQFSSIWDFSKMVSPSLNESSAGFSASKS